MVTPSLNVASHLAAMAERNPDTLAVACPVARDPNGGLSYQQTTFTELNRACDAIAHGLAEIGITRGVRTVLMVPPSRDFFALTFALFKVGAVPVFVDPGMGLPSLKQCLAEAEPQAFIGIPKAHVARIALGWGKATIERTVTVGRRWLWGGHRLERVREHGKRHGTYDAITPASDDVAAILFTSGATGVPKAAVYTHGMFATQVEMIRKTYAIEPGEIDLPTLPLFALFDPALGMSAIIPKMDFSRPARVDAGMLLDAIERFSVTNTFGSPAVVKRLGDYLETHGGDPSSLRRILSAGAPASPPAIARLAAHLRSGAEIHTPYGATESLPITTIGSREVLAEAPQTANGRGVLIGRPLSGIDVDIIAISDAPIADWHDVTRLPRGQIGEIVVHGAVVSQAYYGRPESTAAAKIRDGARYRHRMGDVGYFDGDGRLWFCGRKAHRVTTTSAEHYSIPVEGIANTHEAVSRSALVRLTDPTTGRVEPGLCVELAADVSGLRATILAALREHLAAHDATRAIEHVFIHEAFPVDTRHNSKILREQLSVWANEELARRMQRAAIR